MKIDVKTTTTLSKTGEYGAALFVLAPMIGALCLAWFYYAGASGHSQFAPGLLMAVATLAWLAGCVMLLIGREYNHEIRVSGDAEKPTQF
jgi:hypothetical protein